MKGNRMTKSQEVVDSKSVRDPPYSTNDLSRAGLPRTNMFGIEYSFKQFIEMHSIVVNYMPVNCMKIVL